MKQTDKIEILKEIKVQSISFFVVAYLLLIIGSFLLPWAVINLINTYSHLTYRNILWVSASILFIIVGQINIMLGWIFWIRLRNMALSLNMEIPKIGLISSKKKKEQQMTNIKEEQANSKISNSDAQKVVSKVTEKKDTL